MEGSVRLQPFAKKKGKRGGGGGQYAQVQALQQQVQELQQQLQMQTQRKTQPKNINQRVKKIVENRKGELPVYHRLESAHRSGGIHRVNQELNKIQNELSGTLPGINFFSLTSEICINGHSFYLSQKKYVWYVLESFIRKVGKDHFPKKSEEYDYIYFYNLNGYDVRDKYFWGDFNSIMFLLFLGPVETVNYLKDNINHARLLNISISDSDRESYRISTINKDYRKYKKQEYPGEKEFVKLLKYCLTLYQTYFRNSSNKSTLPAYVVVNGVQGNLKTKVNLVGNIDDITNSILKSFR